MRKVSSTSSSDKGPKARVASLGLGRATVPIEKVEKRRVSAESSSTSSLLPQQHETACTDTAAITGGSSTYYSSLEMSRSSSGGSDTAVTTASSTRSPVVAVPPTSTGPPSLSSLNVETGSTRSEIGSGIETDTPTVKSAVNSPLSSPLATPRSDSFETATVPAISTEATSSTTATGASKGPLASLKAPPRTMSAVSVSSLLAEDGSVAGDETAPSASDVPLASVLTTAGSRSRDDTASIKSSTKEDEDEDEGNQSSVVVQPSEEDREAAVKAELSEYEQEQHDKPMQPLFSPREPTFEAPVEPPEMQNTEATKSPTLEQVQQAKPIPDTLAAPRAEEKAAETTDDEAVNAVKCSDCGASVDLLDLTTHVCAPIQSSPSLSSRGKRLDAYVSQTTEEVPEDVDEHIDAIMADSAHTIIPDSGATGEPDAPDEMADDEHDDGETGGAYGERRPSVPSDVPADETDHSYGSVTIVRTGSRP